MIAKNADADTQWVTVTPSFTAGTGDTPTFTAQLIHSSWQQDGNGNVTITEYDAMGRTYRVDYPDGTFTENLYGINGQPIPGHVVSAQTNIAGYQEAQFDQLGNETDCFYDMAGNLTDEYQPAVSDPYAATVLDSSPTAYWRLDESSGSTAYDSSGNGNNGTYNGTVSHVSGLIANDTDKATSFDGSSTYVSVPDSSAFDSNTISVEAWINCSNFNNLDSIVENRTSGNVGGFSLQNVNGAVYFYVNVAGTWYGASGGTWSTSTTYHVVGTYDGSTVKLYQNGSLVGSVSVSGVINNPSGENFWIGRNSVTGFTGDYFPGTIDEVAVYNYALSSAQISNHYNVGTGSTTQRPHWNYGYDSSGNQTSQTDPNGNATSYGFDSLNNMIGETLPGGQAESWTFDYNFNRLQQSLDFDGNKTVYTYNGFDGTGDQGQISQIAYYLPGGSNPNETVTYSYDNLARKSQSVDSANGTTTWNYDESGGAVTINPTTGAMTNVSNDVAGYLTSVVTPQGTIHYVYDAATGRLVETWTGTGAKSAATTDTIDGYDAFGRLASVTIVKQNGATPTLTSSNTVYYDAKGDSISTSLPTTLYLYDADGNVTKVAYPNGTETDTNLSGYWTPGTGGVFGTETITNKRGSTVLSSFAYSFDADRRKISSLETMTDPGEAATNTALTTWTYDALSRLTQEKYDYGNDDTLSGGAGLTTDDFTDT